MSTRCQVKITDGHHELWFYRHSDGYPAGALPTLKKFMRWVKERLIRNNVEQASGWLIVIGREEYADLEDEPSYEPDKEDRYGMSWKVGAYEPSIPKTHGDIEFLYTLSLNELFIKVEAVEGWDDKQQFKLIEQITDFSGEE